MENWQLKQKQSLPLEVKINMSKRRIIEFYEAMDGDVYISDSGGIDSSVLEHLVRSVYPSIPCLYIDTGLEYPENKRLIRGKKNVVTVKPKMKFYEVIDKHGYPVVSKEQSQYIYQYRTAKSEKTKDTRWNGNKWGRGKISEKWKYLIHAPFEISDKCCDIMKKEPAKKFEKETGLYPYLGVMAEESAQRTTYALQGCNILDSKRPKSKPLNFWTKKDIWDYIKLYNVKYSEVYDMGYDRTGCIFCCYGLAKDDINNHRFHRLKKTHPKHFDYCINELGLGQVLAYLGVSF